MAFFQNPWDTMAQANTASPSNPMTYATGATADPIASYASATNVDNGTNPYYGFAARYQPSAAGAVWSNPWSILTDVFGGMNQAGPGYQALRDIGADPLTLYNIMAGQKSDLSGGTPEGNYINWLAGLYHSLGSVGGRGFSGGELLHSLFNPVAGSGGADGGAGQSALYNILTAGDASTQMRTLFNMARDASNVGLNPLAARGYQAALSRAGDTAINQMMKTDAGTGANNVPLYERLRQIAPGLVPG